MLLHINLESESPIYTQLVQQIIEGIAKKQLIPGEPLPSVRTLGTDLGINLHTVNKAYTILKQEGYVQVHRQKGVIISLLPMSKADETYYFKLHEQLRPLIAEAKCRQVNKQQFVEQCELIFEEFDVKQEELV